MEQSPQPTGVAATPRKTYTPPQLTLFGQVAALTQSVACSASNDGNAACTVSSTSNMGKSSDRRLKANIVRVGDHAKGFGLYLFDYKPEHQAAHGHGRQFGVMADEVEAVVPAAVSVGVDGYRRVNYEALGITLPH